MPKDTSSFQELHEKDYSVLEVVQKKVEEGGRVLIYTSWIRTDTQEKLSNLLAENGYRVGILTVAVPPNKREEWVENQVRDGIQVLITNPSLVETGLDLNDFTTIYYYNISYNLLTSVISCSRCGSPPDGRGASTRKPRGWRFTSLITREPCRTVRSG